MKNKLFISSTVFVFSLLLVRVASASLTLGSTALSSSGVLTITGASDSAWDIGNHTLSLQTTGNGPITTGTGLLTVGGSLSFGTGTIILGDTTGNARGAYATDVQAKHDAGQVASGSYDVAVGSFDTASGSAYALALGTMDVASNTYTTAIGNQNTASAAEATAIGTFNTASAFNSTVLGQSITNNTSNSVMIGPSDSAKVTILSSGYFGVNNSSPQSNIQVGSTNNSAREYLQIDSESGAPAGSDCNSDTQKGRMVHDYTNFKIYVCGGASRGWDHLDLTD